MKFHIHSFSKDFIHLKKQKNVTLCYLILVSSPQFFGWLSFPVSLYLCHVGLYHTLITSARGERH